MRSRNINNFMDDYDDRLKDKINSGELKMTLVVTRVTWYWNMHSSIVRNVEKNLCLPNMHRFQKDLILCIEINKALQINPTTCI